MGKWSNTSKMLTCEELINVIKGIIDEDINIDQQSPLIGGDSSIDSMGLVQICLALEERSHQKAFHLTGHQRKQCLR